LLSIDKKVITVIQYDLHNIHPRRIMNLQNAIHQYLLACRVNNISENTIQGYQYHLGRFERFVGNIPVNELSANLIRAFIAEEMGRKNENTGNDLSSYTSTKLMASSGLSAIGW